MLKSILELNGMECQVICKYAFCSLYSHSNHDASSAILCRSCICMSWNWERCNEISLFVFPPFIPCITEKICWQCLRWLRPLSCIATTSPPFHHLEIASQSNSFFQGFFCESLCQNYNKTSIQEYVLKCYLFKVSRDTLAFAIKCSSVFSLTFQQVYLF